MAGTPDELANRLVAVDQLIKEQQEAMKSQQQTISE